MLPLTPERHLDLFGSFCVHRCKCSRFFFQWGGQPQNCPFPLASGPPSNTWFPGPTRVSPPNGISIGSAVFVRLSNVINRQTCTQTDRPRYSVCSNRPLTLRCGPIIQDVPFNESHLLPMFSFPCRINVKIYTIWPA